LKKSLRIEKPKQKNLKLRIGKAKTLAAGQVLRFQTIFLTLKASDGLIRNFGTTLTINQKMKTGDFYTVFSKGKAMSKKKIINQGKSDDSNRAGWFSFLKRNWLMVLIICFLTLGALGSGLKYLEQDAMRQRRADDGGRRAGNDQSFLNKINPFLAAPSSSTAPQLAKEYLYAGGRLLAVEDADASAAPPADLAVWRPSTGTWWILGGQFSQQFTFQWGADGDKPVPGDYDGDGKTDFSVFRAAANQWWIFHSSSNTYSSITYGTSGDRVAQADYDGDGKTDMAVFRPSNRTWYIRQSGNNQSTQQQFGLSADTPAPADYDGDGRADIAVWRASDTTFYSSNSSNGELVTATFGVNGDKPVSADYDGDGRADYALFRDAAATWYVRNSSNSLIESIQWGVSGDDLVPNDYDGDGKVDIAVWHSSNGNWYIRKSGSGGALRQEAWGTTGDIPVPAFYRR
jgi:hypothetical protein